MKFTLTGSTLANHMRPLNIKVQQHEGTDYDKLTLGIIERNGKKYLNATVSQPTYNIDMHLNLSGIGKDGASDAKIIPQPIDATAEACRACECFTLKETDMRKVNRIVASQKGEYQFSRMSGFTVKAGKTSLSKPSVCEDYNNIVPYAATDEADANDSWAEKPMGSMDAVALSGALDAAIRMSSLTGQKGELLGQAVHFSIIPGHMTIEAVSHNGAIMRGISSELTGEACQQLRQGLHLAVSLDAARTLKLMADSSGETLCYTYTPESHTITIMSNEYTIEIFAENVTECHIPVLDPDGRHVLTMSRSDLHNAVSRIHMSGCGTVSLSSSVEGILNVQSKGSGVLTDVPVTMEGEYTPMSSITLPVPTLLAAIYAFSGKEISLVTDFDDDDVVFIVSGSEDTKAVVCRL